MPLVSLVTFSRSKVLIGMLINESCCQLDFLMSLFPPVPNPPGHLDILAKTNNSIEVKWQEAPLMTSEQFHYRMSITSSSTTVLVSGTNTSHTFASLLSGTPYNLTVRTVGALDFESEEVRIFMVNTSKSFVPVSEKERSNKLWIWIFTTRLSSLAQPGPFSVNDLSVSLVGVNQTTLVWAHPDEYKESYHYTVTWKDSENVSSVQIKENTYNIDDLVPGSLYHFSVTTETFDGTQADSQQISICTGLVIAEIVNPFHFMIIVLNILSNNRCQPGVRATM